MQITRIGSKASAKRSEDWFTGAVRIDPMFDANEARRSAAASVTFELGARTAWHTHPLGQTLIITAGLVGCSERVVRLKKCIPAM